MRKPIGEIGRPVCTSETKKLSPMPGRELDAHAVPPALSCSHQEWQRGKISLLADNGASRSPYCAKAVQVHARGGFSAVVARAGSQSRPTLPVDRPIRLLVPVITSAVIICNRKGLSIAHARTRHSDSSTLAEIPRRLRAILLYGGPLHFSSCLQFSITASPSVEIEPLCSTRSRRAHKAGFRKGAGVETRRIKAEASSQRCRRA